MNSSHHDYQYLHRTVWIWRRRKGGAASCVVICGGEEVSQERREKGRIDGGFYQSFV